VLDSAVSASTLKSVPVARAARLRTATSQYAVKPPQAAGLALVNKKKG